MEQQTECNLCGGTEWGDMNRRKNVRCIKCDSFERTRIIKLLVNKSGFPKPGNRILHFAPEIKLAEHLKLQGKTDYNPVDLFPEIYNAQIGVQKFDMCSDTPNLKSDNYDLIIHSHVLEHIPCNYAAVLYHLFRALKPNGLHIFCIPILKGNYEEDLADLAPEILEKRFGQNDHVRRFGVKDLARTVGMVIKLPDEYNLDKWLTKQEMDKYNIPVSTRIGFSGTSVFPFRKSDCLLSSGPEARG